MNTNIKPSRLKGGRPTNIDPARLRGRGPQGQAPEASIKETINTRLHGVFEGLVAVHAKYFGVLARDHGLTAPRKPGRQGGRAVDHMKFVKPPGGDALPLSDESSPRALV